MTQRNRIAGSRYSARQESGSKALEPETQGKDAASTAPSSRQMQQDDPNVKHETPRPSLRNPSPQGGRQFDSHHGAPQGNPSREGGSRPPGDSAEARGEDHAGQFGYSQGGGAHDNWGAFDGNQQRQSPGYGQDEPSQHHHDADYLHWREEHLRQLDEEYATWRREHYGKFSEEFSQWCDRRSSSHDDAARPQRTQKTDNKIDNEQQRPSLLHRKLK